MFVGCFEISVNVVFKRVQSIGIIRAFCLPGETFQCMGDKKLLGLLGGINTQADTMVATTTALFGLISFIHFSLS